MNLCDLNTIQALLGRHGFHFSKSMGQNFLIDPQIPANIAASSEANKSCGVLEIGPGIGPLTAELAQIAGKVVSIELDKSLLPVLAETMAPYENVEIVPGDAMKLDLQALVEESGIRVIANAAVQKYENGAVVLADGTAVPANMVLVSCGVRANSAIAAAAGAKLGRAIIVNDRMETSLPDVYAAGDCAEFEGMNYALWPEADAQGQTAGANACGDDTHYVSEIYGMTMHLCNTEVYAIGKTGGGEEFYAAESYDPRRKTLKKYFFLDGILCGATLIGDTRDLARVTDLINRGAKYGEVFPA